MDCQRLHAQIVQLDSILPEPTVLDVLWDVRTAIRQQTAFASLDIPGT